GGGAGWGRAGAGRGVVRRAGRREGRRQQGGRNQIVDGESGGVAGPVVGRGDGERDDLTENRRCVVDGLRHGDVHPHRDGLRRGGGGDAAAGRLGRRRGGVGGEAGRQIDVGEAGHVRPHARGGRVERPP